jgi:hypothetical protein
MLRCVNISFPVTAMKPWRFFCVAAEKAKTATF